MYEIKVAGQLSFPLDMLRYDSCYPNKQKDVVEMMKSIDRKKYGKAGEENSMIEVNLVSHKEPEKDRWASFSWSVLEVKDTETSEIIYKR